MIKFYGDFALKLQIVDPLDRPLPKAEDNQAITRDDLVQSLLDLKPIQNNKLYLPLRPQLLEKLEEMLQVEL
jgi:hypothetical protein